MGSPKPDRRRNDPIDRLRHLRLEDLDQEALSDVLHELQVHQEELSAQNTQLVETQHALEESRDRYVDLYDFAPIGYMTVSTGGVIREMNLTGAMLLGTERSRLIGLPFSAFLIAPDKTRFADHLRVCRSVDRSSVTVEVCLNNRTPPPCVQLITRPRRGDGDHGSVLFTAFIDITERRRLEDERRDAEEMRDKLVREREITRARSDAKDHFLATLSHELRTPLTPIMATMSNSRLISLAPEPLLAALQTVRRNLDLEVRLIDDLLDVTRISRDRLVLVKERVNVHVVLQEVVEMLGDEIRRHRIQVVMALSALADGVIGDPTRLRQVFWNLVGNAIKFTGSGGQITITSAARPDGFIRVSVADTGEGMDPGVLHSINEPGDAASLPIQPASGLGLGLAICRGVVNAHGGTLRAASEGPAHGSTLVVEIPIAAQLERWDSPVRDHPSAAERQRPINRILLVEDHPDSADTLSQLLMFHDYKVTVARNVAATLALADQEFDLLISDIRLPDGSGLDLMRQLRARRPIRGIAISGFGTEQDQNRSRDAGYELHLTKPVDFTRLLEAIEHVATCPLPAPETLDR